MNTSYYIYYYTLRSHYLVIKNISLGTERETDKIEGEGQPVTGCLNLTLVILTTRCLPLSFSLISISIKIGDAG